MTAGDYIPLRRQFTDEQIADYKRRAARALHKYGADESIPQVDTSVHDILAAIHPWEFELERDRDGSPGMYGEYGYMRLEQAFKQLELGVKDWVLSAAPPWVGVISEVVWHDAETPQEIEHSTRHAYVSAPDAGQEDESDGGQLAVYLVRTDTIVDDHNAIEGQVLVGVSERDAASETKVRLDDLLAVIHELVKGNGAHGRRRHLSAAARQALRDVLGSTTETTDLLDTETGLWTPADAASAAVELEAAGYGYRNVNGTFQWIIALSGGEE